MRLNSARDLGWYLKEQRQTGKLSQAALAERAGVSRRWLADLEAGKPSVEVGLVFQVVAALGQHLEANPDETPDFDLDGYLDSFGGAS